MKKDKAKVQSRLSKGELRAKGSVQSERSGSPRLKPTRKRPEKLLSERSGSGFNLPNVPNIQWEWNKRGGVEPYYVPDGATKRSEKTYLCYIGLRKLTRWQALGQAELDRNVLAAVEKARSEKNV